MKRPHSITVLCDNPKAARRTKIQNPKGAGMLALVVIHLKTAKQIGVTNCTGGDGAGEQVD